MSVNIHISGEDAAEVIRELSALASILSPTGAVVVPAAEAPKPEKSSRSSCSTSKTEAVKEETPVTPAAEPDPDQKQEEPEEAADAADAADVPTVVDLRAKAQEVATTQEAKKAIKALLDEFESKSISDVPEEMRAAFMVRLEELA